MRTWGVQASPENMPCDDAKAALASGIFRTAPVSPPLRYQAASNSSQIFQSTTFLPRTNSKACPPMARTSCIRTTSFLSWVSFKTHKCELYCNLSLNEAKCVRMQLQRSMFSFSCFIILFCLIARMGIEKIFCIQ